MAHKCLKCDKEFDEPIETKFKEYPGASEQSDFVSPYCGAYYT